MKILHVISSADLADGGPIEGAMRMAEGFARRGHTQDLMTLDDPQAGFLDAIPGRVIALGVEAEGSRSPLTQLQKRLRLTPKAIPWLRAHIGDYDAVIVSGLWNFSTVVVRSVAPYTSTPYFVFTHGMLDPWFGRRYPIKNAIKQLIWLFNERVLLRRAANVLFTCEEERRLAATSFWPYGANERVVGFGAFDPPGDPLTQVGTFRAKVPALGERPYLLFLSRIHEKKGCDVLVEAFAAFARANPGIDLVVAGPDQQGLRPRLEKRCAALGLSERTHWTGMLRDDEKWGALRGCEAFVLPSHQENFGVALAEAMACGRPVLSTHKVNIWREIEADGAGIITADDVPSVQDGMLRFARMPLAAREAMGQSSRQSFVRRYQFEGFIDGMEQLLLDGCAARADRRAELANVC
jgi:glycosyltransferase involved in cell wall biosynthesis